MMCSSCSSIQAPTGLGRKRAFFSLEQLRYALLNDVRWMKWEYRPGVVLAAMKSIMSSYDLATFILFEVCCGFAFLSAYRRWWAHAFRNTGCGRSPTCPWIRRGLR